MPYSFLPLPCLNVLSWTGLLLDLAISAVNLHSFSPPPPAYQKTPIFWPFSIVGTNGRKTKQKGPNRVSPFRVKWKDWWIMEDPKTRGACNNLKQMEHRGFSTHTPLLVSLPTLWFSRIYPAGLQLFCVIDRSYFQCCCFPGQHSKCYKKNRTTWQARRRKIAKTMATQ